MRRSLRLAPAVAVLAFMLVPAAGRAQPRSDAERAVPAWRQVLSSITLAGFAEVAGEPRAASRAAWSLAAVEVDGSIEFGRSVQGAVAIVRDGDRAALGAGFLDLHVGGGRVAPRGAIFAERGVHLQAGRFDLPFGGDWAYFAAPDRGFGAPPLTTELLADGGLNSDGVRLFAVRARWNATTWLVRGGLSGRAMGARLGLTPLSNPFTLSPGIERPVELGVSVHTDGREGLVADQRIATDLTLRSDAANLVAEWQRHRVVRDLGVLTTGVTSGWYIGAEVPWSRNATLAGLVQLRWEGVSGDALWDPALGGAIAGHRLLSGVRVDLGSLVTLKTEVGWAIGGESRALAPVRSWTLNLIAKRW